MKKKETKRVRCNLLQAEIYVRSPECCIDCKSPQKSKDTYFELREKLVKNGTVQELVEVDYPITPESVKSYAAAADYRNDVNAALAAEPRGNNLGDLTAVQELLSSDTEKARALYQNLKKVFEEANVVHGATETPKTEKVTEVNNG